MEPKSMHVQRKQQSLNFWVRVKSRHGSNPVNKLVGTGTFIKGKKLRCQEPLTATHMLLHCPNHKAQRDHLEAALHSLGLVFNLSNVLDPKGAARGPVFSALAKYLLDCQITDKI
ncbi:hypothetical protein DPMN_180430 [Dreissena polymorpha]|uniref:Uncharacterized protein n=1 Tax=Dreissena polymorpha TaxID=45954 RepID=A0A9D4EFV0_DREPO|nr:hypothetical protein DPMN_180430 [Dreissena polymorpha]